MRFEIEINGRNRSVSVERMRAGRYRLVVDGTAHEVDAVRVGNFGLSLILDHDSGLSRDLQVSPAAGPGEFLVTLGGRITSAAIDRRRTAHGGGDGAGDAGEQTVTAPMPGRVVRVLVAPGDEVVNRQGLVVVEAMKMENELRSPKAGRVKDVAVEPGMSVQAGRILMVIE